ncbi:hypothetical protein ACHAWU_001747 [Discostella pseudostelligera]|uniref:Peptidase M11 gametolysin domain-containing protein n=1 Tax=Discostella pseudostelligera TaxID=259834 RepID=A0ABD3MDI3_9STRA
MMISTRWLSALLLTTHLRCSYASLRARDGGVRHEDANRVLQEAQDGEFLIKFTEYDYDYHELGLGIEIAEAGNRRPRKRSRNIQLSDGTIYEVKNARSGWASGLKSGNNHVHIPRGVVLSSNGTIDMMGQALIPSEAVGQGLFNRNLEEGDEDSDATVRRQLQRSIGTRTVLVVRVILDDGRYDTADQNGLSNDVFGNGVDSNNLSSQYAACSANQLLFQKSPNRRMSFNPNDGGTTDINNGVVDIKVPNSISAGDGVIRNEVTTKLNSVFGVGSPVELADHVMYCLPTGTLAGIAYAYINSWNSVYSNEWCNSVSSQMHEIGHNLGFGHANEDGTTYADQTGIMGYSFGSDDFPRMCFNAAQSWQTQWYTSSQETRAHVIKIDDSSSTDVYIAFNRQIGINADTVEAGNEVTVDRAGGEGSSYSETELLAKLVAGERWSGVIDGKTMIVNVLTINTFASPAYASIRISENGNSCRMANPTTTAPSSEPTPAPSTFRPSSASPTSASPTSASPTSASPTSESPTSASPASVSPTIPPTYFPTLIPTSSTDPLTSVSPSTSTQPSLTPSASASPTSTVNPSSAYPSTSVPPSPPSEVSRNTPTMPPKCRPRTSRSMFQ